MKTRTTYRYVVNLNLFHRAFNKFAAKINLNAVHIRLESEHFSNYQLCIDDCNKLIGNLKNHLEEIDDIKLSQGWEANPIRNKKGNLPNLTPAERWTQAEIIHLFLFATDDGEITEKTIPVLVCTVLVESYNKEMLHRLN